MKMPKALTIAFGEIALHRKKLAALEAMGLFVPSVRLTVLGELNPFERTDRSDPGGVKAVLDRDLIQSVLQTAATMDPAHDGLGRARLHR